ncbi:HutD/Ves family protein [Jannaschia rubra]|uniref:Various environmental stresses-induced protein n=1 Tax=Jannaschia rubra TaxID=282197 RepID=A0A0M6XUA9_9RHOB|nr:HutD family protein [Jannaschia rubra]CTQ34680.1 Various environmental stresses-induced protein [Jannaschia rubra]SFG64429.1 hypothetical protein SAMN04488517_10922 [Jannaschia rubra]
MIRMIRYGDLVETPWKNGGGLTREIARGGPGEPAPWRLSRASILRDGPFSRFDGMIRILTIVEGRALTLRVGSSRLMVEPLCPVRFDGGAAAEAQLPAGPVSPLNLMFDPRLHEGRVEVLRGPLERGLPAFPAGNRAVHCVDGDLRVGRQSLHPGDTALSGPSPVRVHLAEGATALLVTLDRRA